MSFIDLMKSDVWSEADIKARLHAEIRSEVSEFAETELNRALQGLAMGLHQLTTAEQAGLARFKACTDRVAALGLAARADMALLADTLKVEAAQRRLALPVLAPVSEGDPPVVANQTAVDADTGERTAAQAVVMAASPAALELVAQRNPVEAV
ncbi:hypothetical protein LP416_27795 [Polaromonas sp. P2-4]|nr:hypothetical protein LP416_27795 [Polaromonas sp. P2-4]